jgi:TonB family protein
MLRNLVIFLALLAAGPASGATLPPGAIEGVDWLSAPSGRDMANYYPDKANRKEISGWATIVCRVTKEGRLTGCQAAAEGPEGYDFGAATVAASKLFRMSPTTADGKSVEGAIVSVPMVWVLGGTLPPKSYRPGDPAMLVTVSPANSGGGERVFSCPSQSVPDRKCQAHLFDWAKQPLAHEIEPLVRKAAPGKSVMECTVGSTGQLSKCQATGSHPAEMDLELLKLANAFQAPSTASDKTPTADNRVVLSFDWKAIARYLDVYEAVRTGR